MSIDFRAQNIQTEKIIVTGDPDAPLDRTQLVIYPIQSQGTPLNQGDIGDTGLVQAIQGTDVFMYVSGAIGGKNASTKGITVFGGDLHVSGNFSIDGSGGGGGGYNGPFPFRPTASDLDTPIITGTITGGVTVTDLSGSVYGGVNNLVQIIATDPQAGTIVQIPITMPVTPLPSNFGVDLTLFTGAPPTDNFQSGLIFNDASGNRFWEIFHSVEVSSSLRPAIQILEIDSGVIGASWNFPDLGSMSNAVQVQATVTKVAPFAAIPQVQFDVTARNFSVHSASVHSVALAVNRTTGSINAGWTGEDFVGSQLVLAFPNTISGSVNLFASVEFLPTLRDLF